MFTSFCYFPSKSSTLKLNLLQHAYVVRYFIVQHDSSCNFTGYSHLKWDADKNNLCGMTRPRRYSHEQAISRKRRVMIPEMGASFLVFAAIVICFITILAFSPEASAKQVEINNNITLHEPPPQPSEQPKSKSDPFTLAIIGLSLGGMCLASSLHWTQHQRKHLETEIHRLDTFFSSNCAVDLHIAGLGDTETMLRMVKDLQDTKRAQLQESAHENDALIKQISNIEAEIMRIWG